MDGLGSKWTVLGQNGRSERVKADGPRRSKWTVKVDGLSGRQSRRSVEKRSVTRENWRLPTDVNDFLAKIDGQFFKSERSQLEKVDDPSR